MEKRWDASNVPDQSGKLAVITGANSGIGFETARILAGKGAEVVLAVRNEDKGRAAVRAIEREYPQARVSAMSLDLADMSNVRTFAAAFRARSRTLSLLINNAGVMAPRYGRTVDGFEMQFGTNHAGHFALTGLLLPAILEAPGARIVTVSSAAHRGGRIDFENLDASRGYSRWRCYGQSKLANLLFAYELQRRLRRAGKDVASVACHPGFAATNLTAAGFGMNRGWFKGVAAFANLAAQSAEMGALPTLFAATEENIRGGEFIGPTGRSGMKGYPGKVESTARSRDEAAAQRLWRVSEELTGVTYSAID